MRSKLTVFMVAAIVFLCWPALTFAHHGEARYDMTKLVTMKGKVIEFQFSNPHAELQFETRDAKGNVEQWVGEATSPNMLARVGWSKATVKPGDQITATGYRGKGDTKVLLIDKIVLPNGETLQGHVLADK